MGLLGRMGVLAGVLGGMAAMAAALLWWRSEEHIRARRSTDGFAAAIPRDAASIARGRAIAREKGCFACHGASLEGRVVADDGPLGRGRLVAPNLAALGKSQNPAVLAAAMREGLGAGGRALVTPRPHAFAALSDSDAAALIGFLQDAPVAERPLPMAYLGLGARWELVKSRDLDRLAGATRAGTLAGGGQ